MQRYEFEYVFLLVYSDLVKLFFLNSQRTKVFFFVTLRTKGRGSF